MPGFAPEDPAEARAYLTEVGRLWAAWLVAVAALVLVPGLWALPVGIVTIALLGLLYRPLHRRAASVEDPAGTVEVRTVLGVRTVTRRDAAARELLYGEATLTAAAEAAGRSPAPWRWARRALLAGTFVAFAYVLVEVS